mmetsp:Transcript_17952/g.43156  ORF Transcript_17952/g.43156 Transcript_17952/m.43156 type:complete len:102 (+) Transcript_17952:1849-2154(+)
MAPSRRAEFLDNQNILNLISRFHVSKYQSNFPRSVIRTRRHRRNNAPPPLAVIYHDDSRDDNYLMRVEPPLGRRRTRLQRVRHVLPARSPWEWNKEESIAV